MIVIDSTGEVYFDTSAVQAAVSEFDGEHCGFGDFVGRPHLVSGSAVDLLAQAPMEEGQQLIEEVAE